MERRPEIGDERCKKSSVNTFRPCYYQTSPGRKFSLFPSLLLCDLNQFWNAGVLLQLPPWQVLVVVRPRRRHGAGHDARAVVSAERGRRTRLVHLLARLLSAGARQRGPLVLHPARLELHDEAEEVLVGHGGGLGRRGRHDRRVPL